MVSNETKIPSTTFIQISLQDIRQNDWTITTYIQVQSWCHIEFIHLTVFKVQGKISGLWNIGHHDISHDRSKSHMAIRFMTVRFCLHHRNHFTKISNCSDKNIYLGIKTLTQCDLNSNGNAGNKDDCNSSPCTSYRQAKNWEIKQAWLSSITWYNGSDNGSGLYHQKAWWWSLNVLAEYDSEDPDQTA